MRALLVARNGLLELVREPKLLAMILFFPIAFLAIFALAGSGPLMPTHKLLVAADGPRGAELVEGLRRATHDDGRPVFEVVRAPARAEADELLRAGKASAMIVVEETVPPRVVLRGDAVNLAFLQASPLLQRMVRSEADARRGAAPVTEIVERAAGSTQVRTEFDVYAPGVLVFAILLSVPQTALFVAREVRRRTLRRLRMTPLRASELFAGITLSGLAVAAVEIALVLALAPLLGFHGDGSRLGTLVVGLALAFSGVGLGLLVGCFTPTDGQAANVGGGVMMVQVFLSGSFFALPPMTVTSIAGHEVGPFDVLPATHGLLAMREVLVQGASLGQVTFRLLATLALSLVYFAIGVAVFRRLRMGATA